MRCKLSSSSRNGNTNLRVNEWNLPSFLSRNLSFLLKRIFSRYRISTLHCSDNDILFKKLWKTFPVVQKDAFLLHGLSSLNVSKNVTSLFSSPYQLLTYGTPIITSLWWMKFWFLWANLEVYPSAHLESYWIT